MKHQKHLSYLTIFLIIVITVSCRKNQKLADAEKIVNEWIGKKIILPSDIRCTYMGREATCPNINTPYKILVYTDSTGCTSCKLALDKWNSLMNEVDTLMTGQVCFLFYFQPKNEKELYFLMKGSDFNQTVFMDNESKLNAANKLPNRMNYQCFLLDKDNKVVLIGNPTIDPKMWDLYKQIIIGERSPKQNNINLTTAEVEQAEIELKGLKVHKMATGAFMLKNSGNVPLLIKDITTSCGCTVPEWDKHPIKPGGKTEIKVKVTPDTSGYFRKTITVFCNTKKGSIRLTVKSTVES